MSFKVSKTPNQQGLAVQGFNVADEAILHGLAGLMKSVYSVPQCTSIGVEDGGVKTKVAN